MQGGHFFSKLISDVDTDASCVINSPKRKSDYAQEIARLLMFWEVHVEVKSFWFLLGCERMDRSMIIDKMSSTRRHGQL